MCEKIDTVSLHRPKFENEEADKVSESKFNDLLSAGIELTGEYHADCDLLIAEISRLKAIIESNGDIDCDYLCAKCSHPYNVEAGENEDCPRCGSDGT